MPHFDLGALAYGADYNPEQWPREVWREDVRLMGEAGVNLVSLGIFSWAQLEPREGAFEFGWLDEIMNLLHGGRAGEPRYGDRLSPPWLSLAYPDSRPVTVDGVRLEVGARQLYCPSDPHYRALSVRLARTVAERYGTHPALRLWHVNNEYGCHIDQCYCAQCAARFREWLRARYGTLIELNRAWGTAFWSQRYGDWAEVQPPRRAPSFPNPSQGLDWRRFSSDNILELHRAEVEVLREVTPDIPVTTNFLGFLPGLDYFRWAQEEDVAAVDVYPDPAGAAPHLEAGMVFDLTRSLRGGQRWLLMEQATSAVNWRERNAPKRPGLMRALSLQALARGADGIQFFQWRQSVAGAEKYHSALVGHVPPERSRVWREARDLGQELRGLDFLRGARVKADVAVMFDWHSWWALSQASQPAVTPLLPVVGAWYAALRSLGVNVDFVHPEADLSGYRAVTLPQQYLLTPDAAQGIRAFVEGGGTLVMGPYSGVVDGDDHVVPGGYPGLLQDVLGAWVEEWAPLQTGEEREVRWADGRVTPVTEWTEVLHADSAEVLATYEADFIAGQPAVTRHAFGQGYAYYLSTRPDAAALTDLLRGALQGAGVAIAELPDGLDVTLSDTGDGRLLHLIHFGPQAVTVQVPQASDARSGQPRASVTLHPTDAALLRVPVDFSLHELTARAAASIPT